MPTVTISRRNKRLATLGQRSCGVRRVNSSKNARYLLVIHLVRQTIGSKQVKVAGLRMVPLNISLNRSLRSNRPRNQIPHRRLCRLLSSNLPRTKLLFHQRMVIRKLLQPTPPPPITPAVAHMRKPQGRRIRGTRVGMTRRRPTRAAMAAIGHRRMQQSNHRSTHPRHLRRVPGLLIHRLVRRIDSRTKPRLRPSRTPRMRHQVSKKRVSRKIAGHFTSSSPTHAITHDEHAILRRSRASILVTVSDAATVREHSVDKMIGRHTRTRNQPAENNTRSNRRDQGYVSVRCGEHAE